MCYFIDLSIYLFSIQRKHFRRGQLSLCWVFKFVRIPGFHFPKFLWRSEQLLHQQSAFCPLICVFCHPHSVGPLFLLDCEEVCFVFVWLLHCYDNRMYMSNTNTIPVLKSCGCYLIKAYSPKVLPKHRSPHYSVNVPTSACASPPTLCFLSCHQILSTMN